MDKRKVILIFTQYKFHRKVLGIIRSAYGDITPVQSIAEDDELDVHITNREPDLSSVDLQT